MQIRKIPCSTSLAFDSAHVKYGVWTWPLTLVQCEDHGLIIKVAPFYPIWPTATSLSNFRALPNTNTVARWGTEGGIGQKHGEIAEMIYKLRLQTWQNNACCKKLSLTNDFKFRKIIFFHNIFKAFNNMRCFVMFVTAVCILFLFKLKWSKNKSF